MRPVGSENVTVTSRHMGDLSVVLNPDLHPVDAAAVLRTMADELEQRVSELEGGAAA